MESDQKDTEPNQDNKEPQSDKPIVEERPTVQSLPAIIAISQKLVIQSKLSEDIAKEVSMEEKFPTKIVEDKSGIFVDYDPASAVSKLQNIVCLDAPQRFKHFSLRLTYVKHLSIILKELGQSGVTLLKKLFQDIVKPDLMQMKDREDLKSALLKQVPDLIIYFESLENSYQRLKEYVVPLLVSFLYTSQPNIKQQAGQYLAAVSHKLNDKDRGECVLKHVIEMAHDDSNEQNRIVAVQLFSKMADSFGRDLCDQFIGLELLSLGQDSHLKVRQQAIINLPIISKEVSQSFFKNRLFKFYQKKSAEVNWGIRKSCVDIIIEMANICDQSTRETLLTEIMLSLIRDNHKWVKIPAYKNLGAFIATLKNHVINDKLLESYIKMSTHEINDLSPENEIFYSCAYNFPAVLYTLGAASWQALYPTYQRLMKVPDKKIKKTLANSLHEVARIIGEQNTRNYLFNILDSFLKDSSKFACYVDDEIKLGAIQHLSEIIQILDEQKREQLIDIFLILQKDQKKWRIRQSIAHQLTTLSSIYPIQMVFTYIVPIAFKFCTDTVSIVREQASNKIGDIAHQFSTKPGGEAFLPAIIENIKGFSISTKYTQRQTFAMMCEKLIRQTELFEQHFLKILEELSHDRIVNVRIVVARVVSRYISEKGPFESNATFQTIIETLRKDPNQQISEMFEGI